MQVTGGSTLIVSIPVQWASDAGISRGDEVTLTQKNDRSILITPKPRIREGITKAVIELSPTERLDNSLRKIIAHYLVGYDLIKLVSQRDFKPEGRKWLKDQIRQRLIGFEVVKESSNELTLRSLLSHDNLSLQDAIDSMHKIVRSMQIDSVKALEGDESFAMDIIQRDNEADRYYLLMVRQLKAAIRDLEFAKKIGITGPRDVMGYRLIVRSMERMADYAELIARNATKISSKVPVMDEIFDLNEIATDCFDASLKALLGRDVKDANDVIARAETASEMKMSIFEHMLKSDLGPIEKIHMGHILESLERMADHSADMAEVVINMCVSDPESM